MNLKCYYIEAFIFGGVGGGDPFKICIILTVTPSNCTIFKSVFQYIPLHKTLKRLKS